MRTLRTLAGCALLAALLALATGAPTALAEEDTEERRARLKRAQTEFEKQEADFVRRVNEAIERGKDWLLAQQRPDGHWPTYKENVLDKLYAGRVALVLLTLSKCGLEHDGRDKVLSKALVTFEGWRDWFAAKAPGTSAAGGHTYSNAVLVLMYESIFAKPPKPRRRGRKRSNPRKLPKKVLSEMTELVQWLERTQRAQIWRYPGPADKDQDLSNAQYALLALQSAGRCGIEVDPGVYRKALAYLIENQQRTGPEVQLWIANPAWQPGIDRYGPVMPASKARARGWGYLPGSKATGSMTTAGVTSLAIIKERLRDQGVLRDEERKQIDLALRDGVGWFSRHFAADRNPENPSWHYYYLYGLERAGDLLGLRYMGQHDWYRVGAEYLIQAQQAGGSWPAAHGDPNAHGETELIRTCFALLFLKRATVPPSVPLGPVVTGG